jgi:hypothetical protein
MLYTVLLPAPETQSDETDQPLPVQKRTRKTSKERS